MKKLDDLSYKKIISRRETTSKALIANAGLYTGSVVGSFLCGINLPLIATFGLCGVNMAGALLLKKYNNYIYSDKPIEKIKKIYDEIVVDLAKLSLEMDNKEALEHFMLLNYMYNHNLLSCSKSDNDFYSDVYDLDYMGTFTLNGHGVCRHTSTFGYDYFKELGFDSDLAIGVLEKNYDYFKNQIIELNCNDDMDPERTAKIVESFYQNEVEDKKEKIKNNNSDHMIFKVNDSNYSYFFDISNSVTYVSDDFKNFRHPIYNFTRLDGPVLDRFRELYNIEAIDDKCTPSDEYIKDISEQTGKKLFSNLDLLFKFNIDNRDKLEEAELIYQKSLKKKKLSNK